MGNWFRKPKPKETSRITEQDRAVLQLKQQRDKLKQYQKRISGQLAKEKEVAKQLLKDGKKSKALLLLKKKRYQEHMLKNTDQQIENLERMVHDIEFAQIEVQVMEGLKTGNVALKKIHEMMSLEQVEKILDETQESVEYQREIDALLSGSLTKDDEDECLEELEQLLSEEAGKKEVALPDVPTEKLPDKAAPSAEISAKQATKHKEKVAVPAS